MTEAAAEPVPFLDLRRRSPDEDAALLAAFSRVLQSGKYILGDEVTRFEAQCAERLAVAHALGVSSGTDALTVALLALGVGPGDEVICPTYTFIATAGAVARLGATPVFVDCDDGDDMAMSAAGTVRALTKKTKAVIAVHLFGRCANVTPLLDLPVPLIEDAAQAFLATLNGRSAGTRGRVGCFSFFPTKNLGALGDAGLVCTSDAALDQRMRALRVHGGAGDAARYEHAFVGGNFRLDALQAALLSVKLGAVDAGVARRVAHAQRYAAAFSAERLSAHLRWPQPLTDGSHTFNQYVVTLRSPEQRPRLVDHLRSRGIDTRIYYPLPLHLQPCFATLGGRPGDHPVAEGLAASTLALPIFAELRSDEVDRVAGAVAEFFA